MNVSGGHPPVWADDKISEDDLLRFRGDNPYVCQSGGVNRSELGYCLTYYYTKATCSDLLDLFFEDGRFGVVAHTLDGRLVSRDVLDSVQEVDFLRRHVGIHVGSWNLLDIGAGYGRLVHRLHQATLDGTRVFATDAVPESTFISEYYLAIRKTRRTTVVPLPKVENLLSEKKIDVAINVHSFSECSLAAIDWWTSRIASAKVKFLMVVPDRVGKGEPRCLTNDDGDMQLVFEKHGYGLAHVEPRYLDPLVQKYGIDPSHMFLFELTGS